MCFEEQYQEVRSVKAVGGPPLHVEQVLLETGRDLMALGWFTLDKGSASI